MQFILIAVLLGLWLATCKININNTNSFGKVLRPFYKMSTGLYQITSRLLEAMGYYVKLREKLHTLYPNQDKNDIIKQFICYKVMWVLMLILFGSVLSLGLQNLQKETAVQTVERDSYWGGEHVENLQVSIDGVMDKEPFQFRIKEQKYPEDKIQDLLQKKGKQLEKLILGQNKSIDYVTTDLNLIRKIPNTDIEVMWEIDNEDVMESDGKLHMDELKSEGTLVQLTATLFYENHSYIYSFYVHVFQKEISEKESFKRKLLNEIEKQDKDTDTQSAVKLPEEINGKKVVFLRVTEKYAEKILIFIVLFSVLLFFVQDERLNKQLVMRKSQLLCDYPEIVSKMTLLLGAGMTIRGTIEKITEDYIKSKKKNHFRQRYVYDELVIICREMQSGVSERAAIDHWGKRCQLQCYTKFSTILQQNLKKGSEGLAALLSYEVSEAFEKRKSIAKKKGEEAGTKLLVPMLFMLLIVLVILMLPACMSFQI